MNMNDITLQRKIISLQDDDNNNNNRKYSEDRWSSGDQYEHQMVWGICGVRAAEQKAGPGHNLVLSLSAEMLQK